MKPFTFLPLITIIVGSFSCVAAAESQWEFSGYFKSFAVIQDDIDNDLVNEEKRYESQSALRLMLESHGEKTSWQLHYELIPTFNSNVPSFDNKTLFFSRDAYRYSDLQRILADEGSKHPVYQNLDRFNVRINLNVGDLTLGRQAIAFGSARFINPSDVFLPFDLRTFNQEFRTGIDAVRFQMPLGQLGEMDTGIVMGEDADKYRSAAYLNLRTHIGGIDIQTLVMRFSKHNLIGAGIETSLGNAGFWFEAAKVFGSNGYLRVSTGIDYAISENTFTMLEYHYNDASEGKPEHYLSQLSSTAYQDGGVFLFGKNYVLFSLSQNLSPLWNLSASLIENLNDSSRYLTVKTEYNVQENLYFDAGYYHYDGKKLTQDFAPPFFRLESEFGSNPDILFLSARYYF